MGFIGGGETISGFEEGGGGIRSFRFVPGGEEAGLEGGLGLEVIGWLLREHYNFSAIIFNIFVHKVRI